MYSVGKILLFAICFKRDPKFLHRDSGIVVKCWEIDTWLLSSLLQAGKMCLSLQTQENMYLYNQ